MERVIVAIFSTDEIKTGAHRRYVELINGFYKKGYETVCFAKENVFAVEQDNFIKLNIKKSSRFPITFQLVKEVLSKSKTNLSKKDKITVITFGETTALAALALKIKFNAEIVFGIRTNIYEDRKISIISEGIRIGNKRIRNKFIISMYLYFFRCYEKYCIVFRIL